MRAIEPKSLWAPQVSDALITQVILLSSLVMMFATAFAKATGKDPEENPS